MATKKKPIESSSSKKKLPPAMTQEARENQLIALAYDLVEQRLLDGTASAQETTHFLKLGSLKERKELQMLDKQIELAEAKRQKLKSEEKIEELYTNAISAMREYSGYGVKDEDIEYIDE